MPKSSKLFNLHAELKKNNMKKSILLGFIFFLLTPTLIPAQTVTLKKICNISSHYSPRSVHCNGYLYTLDYFLYKTNLATGEDVKLGNENFNESGFFFSVGNRLYLMENNGSMKQIDIQTGVSKMVNPIRSWQNISRVVPVGNNFFTVSYGSLYHHPTMQPQKFKKMGGVDFASVSMLLLTDSTVHTIIGRTIYQIDLQTGEWKKISNNKSWRNFNIGAVVRDKLYSIENSGAFIITDLKDGKRKQIANTLFLKPKPIMMFPDSGKFYYLNNDYDLFEVVITEKNPN